LADVEWHEPGFAELLSKVKADVERRSLRVEGAAKGLAPVDTGRLRSSITHEVEVQGAEVVGRIGTNVEYAIFQEFGTSRMPAHPYLRPGLAAAGE
jgi:HK97 gp10 family phage protein